MKTQCTITVLGPTTLTITVSNGQPELLPCTTFQGVGGVDQLDVSNLDPGLYCFDSADEGFKVVRLNAGTPAAIAPGTFLPINCPPGAPKYWTVR